MLNPRYNLGIDLGTSNSALAFCKGDDEPVQILDIEQVQRLGEIFASQTLPSALYLPHENEFKETDVRLPWQAKGDTRYVVGNWALSRGTLSPDRLIVSAKSWLISPFTDPRETFLPWSSEHTVKFSPLQTLTAYLEHVRDAFVYTCKQRNEDVVVAEQNVVITIPASFDELARQLTLEAAQKAGFQHLTLLEEPQAAFYSFVAQNSRYILRLNWHVFIEIYMLRPNPFLNLRHS